MDIRIADAIQADPGLLAAIDQANRVIEEEIGGSSLQPSVEWQGLPPEGGQAPVRLSSHFAGDSVAAQFVRADLLDADRIPSRLGRLWDSLLAKRSHAHQRNIARLLEQLEGDRARCRPRLTRTSSGS